MFFRINLAKKRKARLADTLVDLERANFAIEEWEAQRTMLTARAERLRVAVEADDAEIATKAALKRQLHPQRFSVGGQVPFMRPPAPPATPSDD